MTVSHRWEDNRFGRLGGKFVTLLSVGQRVKTPRGLGEVSQVWRDTRANNDDRVWVKLDSGGGSVFRPPEVKLIDE